MNEATQESVRLSVFPLNTVLFPSGYLPLRIFEPRYLDMVKHCVQHNTHFVVCLIQSGTEVSSHVSFCSLGTECQIVDWETTTDGLLGITIEGVHRVKISKERVADNGLISASVIRLSELPDEPLPEEFSEWRELLKKIIYRLGKPYVNMQQNFDSAGWVGSRLIEYLPLDLRQKQEFLTLDHPVMRMQHLIDSLKDVEYYLKAGKFKGH